jgi:hypothetical protein
LGAKKEIITELTRVRKWFTTRGTYYDCDGNIFTAGGELKKRASRATRGHMEGRMDPKSYKPFTPDQEEQLNALQSHNLAHKSYKNKEEINGLSLPEGKTSVSECKVDELKAIVISRGGSVTGKDGKAFNSKELQQLVKAYLFGEKKNIIHTVFFDRSKTSNGVFAKIDTSERMTVPNIINNLHQSGESSSSDF